MKSNESVAGKTKKRLPTYLNEEEFQNLLKNTLKKHHKVAFILAFASGLRVSEITCKYILTL